MHMDTRAPCTSTHTTEQGCKRPHCVQIYGFRMSLWEEHLNTLKPSFERPESLECVREVAAMCQVNWEAFNQEEVCEVPGHLMPYPIVVRAIPRPCCAF